MTTVRRGARSRRGRRSEVRGRRKPRSAAQLPPRTSDLVEQLADIERSRRDGELSFADGRTLRVTSLDRVVFPRDGVTKGDLMRYYARVAPVLLPILADRPLALKRYPDGVAGPAFFQQNATKYPPSVRVERVKTEAGKPAPRFIGGDLPTLLYLVQIGTIALHAWQSRVGSLDHADYSTIDLDPGEGVRFARVVELARMLGERVRARNLAAAVKTSGSSGIHIAIPLPPHTSFAASTRLAEQIAREIVDARPETATLERRIEDRPPGTIYIDVQQNARGKSVVSAYSVRARHGAPVSTPLGWPELTGTLRLERFTVQTVPRRLERVGDLWGEILLVHNRDVAIAKRP